MPSPFPGMDPYIERPEIWPDFHDSLITYIRAALQPLLRPRYVALTQDRLYVVESDRPIRPDVAVVRTSSPKAAAGTSLAVLEADAPAVFELWDEEVRQPLIQIIEPAAGNRVVTAIEVLSPDNKAKGAGRTSYLRKRKEYRMGGANVIEIDLLHGTADGRGVPKTSGDPGPLALPCRCKTAPAGPAGSLRRSANAALPRVAVPLSKDDPDVVLDLQAAFTRCWEEGPYPELLRYDGPPPGTLTPDEIRWCEDKLRQAGFRPPVQGPTG